MQNQGPKLSQIVLYTTIKYVSYFRADKNKHPRARPWYLISVIDKESHNACGQKRKPHKAQPFLRGDATYSHIRQWDPAYDRIIAKKTDRN